MKLTEVAVGVVLRGDGAVLIGQRLAGKPYAGWWEFPGGKFEPGEDAGRALARELDEELGIAVQASEPWVVREHVYPHAHVRLHFRRVVRWSGTVRAREGQAFVWCHPDAVEVGPLLPAALAPVGWLGLPAEYAISDAAALGTAVFLARLDARLAGAGAAPGSTAGPPLRLLLLREPLLAAGEFEALFDSVVGCCRAAGARLLVSSRHPRRCWVAAAEQTGGGVHLTGRDLAAAATVLGDRGTLRLVAASCHQPGELVRAGEIGVDFAVLAPVAAAAGHPGALPLGWPAFTDAIAATPVPVYALGGLGRADLEVAQRCGAHGIAMQRAAW
ncbi:MAG: Nudix family hydrolase, partial [Lautropia sp.]